ncbi:hybrid sensor histidine kinase/response regulator [Kamptonema formosum]|uniref:hybrid sensor histidine kinase/response regulator n=1 Tax=Kamptonema formosum TaxID=331992 RepID=UPI00034760F9|nr:ATP-binding protein [Oscillatoria sp. PCC 10802]
MSTVKILVVEDEAIIAEDIASRLEKMGYSVVDIVATGSDAISAATANQPNLVLMDIMLQGKMDGIEAADRIRTLLGIPVVYLTANADETTLQRAKITGPFGYILKPFKEKELRATIEIALSRHQVELEMQEALASAEAIRKEAQQLSQRKSQYVSMASHEFRTPLSVIKFSAALLRDYGSKWSEEKKEKHLLRIQAAADSMNQLLEEVLTLGRAESGRLEFNPAPLDAVSFCQELVEALQITAGDQHTLTFTAEGNCTPACLDDKLLWHIFNNLLSNAIKYSPQGSTVFFTLSCEESRLCFQVRDEGIGISKEDQQRLFEPFNRASNVGDIPGTGLGLAIVKKAVELHGGQIEVESEIGRGTAFTVTLPLAASA